jgi:predicted nucleic acid-binding Zn ribbon protein
MRLGDAIDRYLKRAGLKTLVSSKDVWKEWTSLVGDEIAAQTRISRFSKGVLTIDVSSSALLSELRNYLYESLVSSLSGRLKRPVHTIKFRLADSVQTEHFSPETLSGKQT